MNVQPRQQQPTPPPRARGALQERPLPPRPPAVGLRHAIAGVVLALFAIPGGRELWNSFQSAESTDRQLADLVNGANDYGNEFSDVEVEEKLPIINQFSDIQASTKTHYTACQFTDFEIEHKIFRECDIKAAHAEVANYYNAIATLGEASGNGCFELELSGEPTNDQGETVVSRDPSSSEFLVYQALANSSTAIGGYLTNCQFSGPAAGNVDAMLSYGESVTLVRSTESPTGVPTDAPTDAPTAEPTTEPTTEPTASSSTNNKLTSLKQDTCANPPSTVLDSSVKISLDGADALYGDEVEEKLPIIHQ